MSNNYGPIGFELCVTDKYEGSQTSADNQKAIGLQPCKKESPHISRFFSCMFFFFVFFCFLFKSQKDHKEAIQRKGHAHLESGIFNRESLGKRSQCANLLSNHKEIKDANKLREVK